jgi:hypothetical protein
VLADRYVVEDMLVEEGTAESWRAFDRVLSRSVVLQVVPSSSPSARRLIEAAKQASRVADPRILKVLDAVDDGALTYVVREWVSGQTLDLLLAEGPLPARRAAWLLREVADAVAAAHQDGVAHGCLVPSSVVLSDAGGLKILGLATFAALHDGSPTLAAAQHEDAQALGRLLYACLTARWPGAGCSTLPEAPTVRGRYLRPRQIRAGVPRTLDALCDRILSLNSPPGQGKSLTTATEVKDALTHLLAAGATAGGSTATRAGQPEPATTRPASPPPAVLSRGDRARPGAVPLATPSAPQRRLSASVLWAALALLVAGTMVAAYLVDHHAGPAPSSRSAASPPTTGTGTALRQLPIVHASSFDPYPGSGSENQGLVPLAVDSNPKTAWRTLTYRGSPRLGGIKKGVGLVLDLGRVRHVSEVAVTLRGRPTSLQLRAAPAAAHVAPQRSASQYRLLDRLRQAGQSAVFRLNRPAATRFLLVWLTSLPPQGDSTYRGAVAEVKVFG